MKFSSLICFSFYIFLCDCYEILVVFTTPMKSHNVLGESIVNLLLNAGHEVTYVTAFPRETFPSKMHQVDVSNAEEGYNIKNYINSVRNPFASLRHVMYYTHGINVKAMNNENLQRLLYNSTKKYDLMILDAMYSDILVGIAAVYDCPYIWVSSIHPHWHILRLIDELPNPTKVPDCCSLDGYLPQNIWDRIQELQYQISSIYFRDVEFYNAENIEYRKLFSPILASRGKELPSFNKLRYNASLVLSNSHPAMAHPIKLPPNFISLGGFHIEDKKHSLPKDLQIIMDNAKDGVIFFSLGSILRSRDIPEDMKREILKVFGELKQTVIWKMEETVTELPHNVHILKWAPQQEILAHPNCVLFITHGGLLSVTEAFHFGVPIVGIPVFADQFKNINLVLQKGFGKRVDLTYHLPRDLKLAIDEILQDERFTEKAKEWSAIFRHRLVHPGVELVHWVEHVILTGGASYLRSPALDEPLYKNMGLDILGFIILFLVGVALLLIKLKKLLLTKIKLLKTE